MDIRCGRRTSAPFKSYLFKLRTFSDIGCTVPSTKRVSLALSRNTPLGETTLLAERDPVIL